MNAAKPTEEEEEKISIIKGDEEQAEKAGAQAGTSCLKNDFCSVPD